MFTFAASPFTVPDSIREMCVDTWRRLAAPGAVWTGPERVAIATCARAVRLGSDPEPAALPAAAMTAIDVLAARPASTTREWVDAIVAEIGEAAYVEIVGIVARVVAIDTFSRLVGITPVPFPLPQPGSPIPPEPPRSARKGKAWIPMAGFPIPPSVLSLVPAEQASTNATAETLYMTGTDMNDADIAIDGLHRTQIEIVATSVSHRNECFY